MLDKLHLQVNQIRLIFRQFFCKFEWIIILSITYFSFILGALEAHKDARKKILSTTDQVHLTLLDKVINYLMFFLYITQTQHLQFMLQQLKNLYKESLENYLGNIYLKSIKK